MTELNSFKDRTDFSLLDGELRRIKGALVDYYQGNTGVKACLGTIERIIADTISVSPRHQQTGHCRHCGSKIQQSHKEILSRSKLDLLQMAARHVIESGVKEFQKKDVADFAKNPSNYNNFQKLRYHGLIAQSGLRSQWVITRNGWAFLRGDKELPKFVLVRNNHIVDRSPELISAKDVWKGSPEVITYFEYYDDDGNYVGIRPNTVPMKDQPSFF